ncbi:MAG: Smr/MutS family protein [Pseudomonas sp.]|jgi:DNA-nicking Smr family endonuclease|nr:Smr/MutS family protein [Pseudomonas sp.]MDD2222632.1 Smr/MutS family protein [Pseudomonas sp.]MDY0413724.1 Smr/MutS family protein [Pseudomonas sp.]NLO53381.1 Smr/MutS family protein [Gammaproteobacteria bacterium]
MPDDEFSLFAQQMQGVRRIHVDYADVGKAKPNRAVQQMNRKNALQSTTEQLVVDGLSDQFVLDVGAEEILYWARDGVQDSQLRRMKAGLIAFEGSLDLHGMSVEKARTTLREFLTEALRLEIRCVRVTHGKAARLDGKKPMIKSHVNTWLRQHDKVLGFTSCAAKHGGAGALYVLLKRHMLDGRDEG